MCTLEADEQDWLRKSSCAKQWIARSKVSIKLMSRRFSELAAMTSRCYELGLDVVRVSVGLDKPTSIPKSLEIALGTYPHDPIDPSITHGRRIAAYIFFLL